jgi:hypothetical protein
MPQLGHNRKFSKRNLYLSEIMKIRFFLSGTDTALRMGLAEPPFLLPSHTGHRKKAPCTYFNGGQDKGGKE